MSSAAAGAATGQLGIDLPTSSDNAQTGSGTYASLNDNSDADTGANLLLNFPVFTQSVVTNTTSGNLEVTGYAPAGALLELFVADRTTAAFGQGKTYLLSVTEGSASDSDTKTGSYSGAVNGLNQGSEGTANRFRIPLASLSAAAQTALLATGARLTATATVASGSGSATSEFAGSALISLNQPLPVHLTAFTAQAVGADARLTWRTAQEVTNGHFLVERSFDGLTNTMGSVKGQGTTSQAHEYTLTDAMVAAKADNQVAYYRLQQLDTDRKASFSPVQTVHFKVSASRLSIWPNPASETATVDLGSLPPGCYQVHVVDATGREVYQVTASGGAALELPAGRWLSGSYLVRVQGLNTAQTLRLIKK